MSDTGQRSLKCPFSAQRPTSQRSFKCWKGGSTIRDQSASNNITREIIVQDVIIQIHKLKIGHEIRDPPDRRAPFRPRDSVAHVRVQIETNRRRRYFERIPPYWCVRGVAVQDDIIGGQEEAKRHVRGRNLTTERLELDLDG